MKNRVYLVEDDAALAALVSDLLAGRGYEVRPAADFSRVMEEFLSFEPRLVIMDLSLPAFNGLYWCSEMRRVSRVPILFLSSRGESMDQVTAMNLGADDYVVKPFLPELLLARVDALFRRAYDYAPEERALTVSGATLLEGACAVRAPGGEVPLTRNELGILSLLMREKNRVVSREALMEKLWDDMDFVDENTLTVNISRLRKKLEGAGLPNFIETRKRLGYLVREENA